MAERRVEEEVASRIALALIEYYIGLLGGGCSPHDHRYLWNYVWQHCSVAGERGITALRKLVKFKPDAFLPDLAGALNNLGIRYSEVGRRQEAVAPMEEAVNTYRELVETNPAFLPDLAMALTNLGIRYSQVGRRQEAVAPAEEAVNTYRELVETNPAFLPDLAGALNNLGILYSEVGMNDEIDGHWDTVLRSLEQPRAKAFLLIRRAETRTAGSPTVIDDLLNAQAMLVDDDRDLIADFHTICRTLRGFSPTTFDAAWLDKSGCMPPAWLLLDNDRIELMVQWLKSETWEIGKRFLAEHRDGLLAGEAETALDEIALYLDDPSVLEPYYSLLRQVRDIGIEEAYQAILSSTEDLMGD
ncbi:tetratricopeptide repeat protein [Pelobacter propionicus]|nr:tetratricopeptide repeat protein [Pelobacter propionicus]